MEEGYWEGEKKYKRVKEKDCENYVITEICRNHKLMNKQIRGLLSESRAK